MRAGQVTLSVLEAGVGGEPLLALHGFTGGKEDFAEAAPGLAAAGWHVVAPDLRGHGGSEAPPGEQHYSLDLFAADVLFLADELGWDRFVLLGHSMGGMVAQLVAVAAPARLQGLVLMDTTHGPIEGVDPASAELGATIAMSDGLDVLADLQDQLGGGPLVSEPHQRLLAERPGYAEFNRRKLVASSPYMYAALVRALVDQVDRLDDLRAVTVPTLVIVGEHDSPFLAPSKRMADSIPGARLAIIPDAGHSPQFESPDAWATALHPFLEEVRA